MERRFANTTLYEIEPDPEGAGSTSGSGSI